MRPIGDLVALVLALAAAAAVAGLWLAHRAGLPGPLAADTVVEIPAGSGVKAIAEALETRGVVDSALLFETLVRLRGESTALRAGEYVMPAGISHDDAAALLVAGKTLVRRITVPEGLTAAEVVALVEAGEGLVGTLAETPAEGSLMPETYHYAKGEPRAAVVARMQDLARETLERLWPKRAEDLPFADPGEAVVLASIVEKETGVAGERARIAGVFVNRLRRGMRLQSDPTVIYALTAGGGPLGRPLLRRDLKVDSPYNTYLHAGLPPGPIANPGRAALEAVLHPLETDELYFVADGSGGHVFARTLEEHNRNAARWRRLERERRRQ